MGCGCSEDRNIGSEVDPKPSTPNAQPPFSNSKPLPSSSEFVGVSISSQTSISRGQLSVRYSLISKYKVGKLKHVQLAELKSTKRRCVIFSQAKTSSTETELLEKRLKLDHPHVRRILECLQDSDWLHVVHEECAGGELSNMLETGQHFVELQVAMIAKQTLEVMSYLHQRNYWHGQLRPEFVAFKECSQNLVIVKISGLVAPSVQTLSPYHAPEAVPGLGSAQADIWTCGVIIYRLLIGELPFQIHSDIRPVSIPSSISPEAAAFLRPMFLMDPVHRPTAETCLSHPWLRRVPKDFTPVDLLKKVEDIENSQLTGSLRVAILRFMIDQLVEPAKVSKASRFFTALDLDHDGLLNKEEITAGLRSVMKEAKAQEVTARLMAVLDRNHSTQVDFSEFLVAALETKALLSDSALLKAFNALDEEKQGWLTNDHLRKVFYVESQAAWAAVLADVHVPSDGKITFDLFRTFMHNVSQ